MRTKVTQMGHQKSTGPSRVQPAGHTQACLGMGLPAGFRRGWACPSQRALCAPERIGPGLFWPTARPCPPAATPPHPGAPHLSSPAGPPFLPQCSHHLTEGRTLGRRPGLCQKHDPGSPWLEARVTPRTAALTLGQADRAGAADRPTLGSQGQETASRRGGGESPLVLPG